MLVGSRRLARCARIFAAFSILASAVLLLFIPAGAQTGGTGSFAEFNNEGWWQKQAFPPNVPGNGLPVSADGGEPSRVTAFGMDVHIGADETLSSLTLILKESTAEGANYPPPPPPQAPSPPATPVPLPGQAPTPPRADIVVVACPVVQIYTPERAGPYADAPVADCDAARGDGVRSSDGTWEFDITSIAELWESNALENKGVLLVERVNPPLTFQVVFQDLSTNTPQLELVTDIVTIDDPTPEPDPEDVTFTEEIPGTPGSDNFFTDIAEGGSGTTTTPLGIVETPPTTVAPEPEPAPRVVSNRRPTKGTLPLAMLLLLPLALGVALVGGLVLGPAGDPATARTREGGLSRALNRRDASFASE